MMYRPAGVGDLGSSGTRHVANFDVVIYPRLMRFHRYSYVTSDVEQPNSVIEQKGRRDDAL
jgi:hypothetical protein